MSTPFAPARPFKVPVKKWMPTITTGGITGLKVYVGAQWSMKPVRVWTGSQWADTTVKRWGGAGWLEVRE